MDQDQQNQQPMTLGRAVLLLRYLSRRTQRELASVLGLSRETVWAIEKGKSNPRLGVVGKLLTLARGEGYYNLAEVFEGFLWRGSGQEESGESEKSGESEDLESDRIQRTITVSELRGKTVCRAAYGDARGQMVSVQVFTDGSAEISWVACGGASPQYTARFIDALRWAEWDAATFVSRIKAGLNPVSVGEQSQAECGELGNGGGAE